MTLISQSINETQEFAEKFVEGLVHGKRATVVGLYGDLGSGKTTFTQCAAQALGIKDRILSPTFVLERRYAIRHKPYANFVHIDAYRIDKLEDASSLRLDELMSDKGNLIFIEWADRIESLLPKDTKKVYFEFVDEGTRHIRTS